MPKKWMLISLAIESVAIPVACIVGTNYLIKAAGLPSWVWLIGILAALVSASLLIMEIQKRL